MTITIYDFDPFEDEQMDAEEVLRKLADSMSCIQVKPFSGGSNENFHAFLNKYETFCEVHQKSEETKLNSCT